MSGVMDLTKPTGWLWYADRMMLSHKLPIALAGVLLCGVSAFGQSPTCDETLWTHVYDPSRLSVVQKCVTVTGTVMDASASPEAHEKDGDRIGWLKLDPGQEKFINEGNQRAQGGNLVFEVICSGPIAEAGAKKACAGFKDQVKVPPAGSHVAITGTWVKDSEGNWFEVHPVTSIVVMK